MVCLGLEPGQQDGRRRQIHYGGTPKIFKIRNWNSQEMKIRGCVVASRPDRSATPNQRILRPFWGHHQFGQQHFLGQLNCWQFG